ncbi:hypothetical protein Y032_0757g2095 [Ancylostoma ceylanicum]|uniref:Uncharacterized protein n=1 Tax=Ancylostoma ceylanicum TaxID=53326 RepID=A0A016WE40_9BILA|nr:hypothetical protein Y032_0757g2095 [Ancylostoma ceylanicum]
MRERGIPENKVRAVQVRYDWSTLRVRTSHLGSILSADGTVDAAVGGRIACAWLKWRESTGILCDRRCSRMLKGKIYHTVVRPAVMYGSECWPVSKKHERMFNTAEMCMLLAMWTNTT